MMRSPPPAPQSMSGESSGKPGDILASSAAGVATFIPACEGEDDRESDLGGPRAMQAAAGLAVRKL